MTEAMPFLQKHNITFLRPPTISGRGFSIALFAKSQYTDNIENTFRGGL